ncbi:hypothetical protein [Flavobacterium sp.]|uniref:hypothetical protein n=1 Tax=Flavobacterium sp. TaxID=239 RepID=UPI003BC86260
MVTPLPLPVMLLPSVPVWVPLSQPVKVPSSKPVLGIAAASTVAVIGMNIPIKNVGINIHAPLDINV